MAVVSPAVLKTFFQTGDFPTQSQFAALIDSFIHRIADRYLLGLKTYDVTLAYLIGDTVVYNLDIYIAIANTGPGVFNPSAWNKIAGLTSGAVVYKGTWDVVANVPDLPAMTTMVKGEYYVVSVGGTRTLGNSNTWNVGDWAIYNGTGWEKVDNTGSVTDGENLGGGGYEVYAGKSGTLLQFKEFKNSDGSIVVTTDANYVDLKMNIADLSVLGNATWSSSKIQAELDEKTDKLIGVLGNNLTAIDSVGNLLDSGKNINDFLPANATAADIEITTIPNISATEVQGALAELETQKMNAFAGPLNNFPFFDGTGNLFNSGYNYFSFLPSSTQALNIPVSPAVEGGSNVQASLTALSSNKANTVSGTANNFPKLNGSGQLTDSGLNAASFLSSTSQAINIPVSPAVEGGTNVQASLTALSSNKANTVSGAANNFAKLNGSGQLTDSGLNAASFLTSSTQASNIPVSPAVAGTTNVQAALESLQANKIAESGFFEVVGPATGITTAQNVLDHTFTSLAPGDYYVEWYYEMAATNASTPCRGRVTLDGTEQGYEFKKSDAANEYFSIAGFQKVNFAGVSPADHNVKIIIEKDSGSGTCSARRLRVRLMRL